MQTSLHEGDVFLRCSDNAGVFFFYHALESLFVPAYFGDI